MYDSSNQILLSGKQNKYSDNWLAKDKAKHLIGSFICTIFISKFCMYSYNESRDKSRYMSTGIVFTLGLAKEFADGRNKNNFFSWKDISSNICGIFLSFLILSVK